MDELEILARAHHLFPDGIRSARPAADIDQLDAALHRAADLNTGGGQDRYRHAVDSARQILRRAAATDADFATLVSHAHRDHALAHHLTRVVLDAARDDRGAPMDSPMAAREAMRRTITRLRTQQQHVVTARRRARRRLAVLLLLRYRGRQRIVGPGRVALPPSGTRAGIAVRAALSRLGMPYVWGATGPDKFDCSGLVQWAYRQAGVGLDRTTYDQIHQGVAVSRSHAQPGDLVFPHSGHVQMAIGNGLVVEAPHAGANVRISSLGSDVVIRRPV